MNIKLPKKVEVEVNQGHNTALRHRHLWKMLLSEFGGFICFYDFNVKSPVRWGRAWEIWEAADCRGCGLEGWEEEEEDEVGTLMKLTLNWIRCNKKKAPAMLFCCLYVAFTCFLNSSKMWVIALAFRITKADAGINRCKALFVSHTRNYTFFFMPQ